MAVTLIAFTVARLWFMEEATDHVWSYDDQSTDMDALGEFAGRACYQSWDKPNPRTRSNRDYLGNVIDLGHESVLSHAGATFYATGVSRSLTHELVRHRWLSFSELSQRYVSAAEAPIVVPPALEDFEDAREVLRGSQALAVGTYTEICEALEARGLSRKQAREAARCVLPNMTETRIVVSGNLRAWRDFLRQRLSPHADAEIRRFAEEVFKQLKQVAPNSMIGIE